MAPRAGFEPTPSLLTERRNPGNTEAGSRLRRGNRGASRARLTDYASSCTIQQLVRRKEASHMPGPWLLKSSWPRQAVRDPSS
jgi:hypothetical protein